VSIFDGQAWEGVDLWIGSRTETVAALHFVPLTYSPTTNKAGDGRVWVPPLPFVC
jgi:hypothetical protein